MLDFVKKNSVFTLSIQDCGADYQCMDEISDTVQTMNISHNLNYSLFLFVLELFSLIVYLAIDFYGRIFSMFSFTIFSFLVFIAFNIYYCRYLLRQERSQKIRRLMKYHTYFFTAVFALYCVVVTYINLQSRLTEESILMFYLYIAAGPIFSKHENAIIVLITALAVLPVLRFGHVPPTFYSNLILYSSISLCLSEMRCRIIVSNLRAMREARNEQMILKEQANIDPLTRLFNRNGYSLRLEEVIPYNIRLKIPVAVLMIDIDFFKQFNDTFGHMQGDECLKKVAQALSGGIHQEKDLICRFGGEEFQILLCDIAPSDAIRVGDRLRKAVEDLAMPAADQSVSRCVTISVGVASGILTSLEDYQKLARAADDELYYAKSHGKNTISFKNLIPKASHELSLEDKLENTRLIYESSPLPFAVIQIVVKNGKPCDFLFTYANEACARLECCTRNELYQKSFLEHYPKSEMSRFGRYYEIAIHGGRQDFFDFRPERSKYLKIECFQFHEGYCGCLLEDVTDQHYLELYGSRQLELLNHVVNAGILLTRHRVEKPEVIYMNSRLLQALGNSSLSEYRLLSVNLESLLDQLYPDDVGRFQETMSIFSTDDTVRSCIVRIRSKEGVWLWFMLRGMLIIDEHSQPLVLFTAYHITRQLRQLEKMIAPGSAE